MEGIIFRTWLEKANFLSALAISVVVTALLAIPLHLASGLEATNIAYAAVSIIVIWRGGSSILRPLLGTRPIIGLLLSASIAAIGTALRLAMPMLIPGGTLEQNPSVSSIQLAANVLVLAPLAETLIFQGWIQTKLGGAMRPSIALVSTAALFLASHLQASVSMAFMAVALCWLRSRSGSLLAVFVAHSVFNLLILLGV